MKKILVLSFALLMISSSVLQGFVPGGVYWDRKKVITKPTPGSGEVSSKSPASYEPYTMQ